MTRKLQAGLGGKKERKKERKGRARLLRKKVGSGVEASWGYYVVCHTDFW